MQKDALCARSSHRATVPGRHEAVCGDMAMSVLSGSLRLRVMRSGGITAVGYAANQLLRFGGNLVLTRLLFPEAFGVMAIMQAVVLGVTMLSDVGITQSIVLHQRGAEPGFVNTAWTIQIS